MKYFVVICFLILSVIVCCLINSISGHKVTKTITHTEAKDPDTNGFWQKKVTWKARWVKSWKPKKYYIPLWKKVWGPVIVNEWTPIPKPPPGWIPHH